MRKNPHGYRCRNALVCLHPSIHPTSHPTPHSHLFVLLSLSWGERSRNKSKLPCMPLSHVLTLAHSPLAQLSANFTLISSVDDDEGLKRVRWSSLLKHLHYMHPAQLSGESGERKSTLFFMACSIYYEPSRTPTICRVIYKQHILHIFWSTVVLYYLNSSVVNLL